MHTSNFEKHTTGNPISRYFLNNFTNVLVEEIKKLQPESILDVGAGEGFILQKLHDNAIGKKLEGIEYMDEAIALGKVMHPQIHLKQGDIYHLPHKDNSFDVVICSEVLEHLENLQEALQELVRVSKRYCVLSVPNEPYFTLQRIARGKNLLKLGDHPEHIQHWTSGAFRNFVDRQLKIVSLRSPIPWTLVVGAK